MPFRTINPATGEHLQDFEYYTSKEIERRLAKASEAFGRWSKISFEHRKKSLFIFA